MRHDRKKQAKIRARMVAKEVACVEYYRKHLATEPDGSFMMNAWKDGWAAAIQSMKKNAATKE